MAGAPKGNQNAARGGMWRNAIKRALDLREVSRADGKKELDAIAEQLVNLASIGDLSALKELGDRLDGKAAQQLIMTGDEENPVTVTSITRRVIMPTDAPPLPINTEEEDDDGISFL